MGFSRLRVEALVLVLSVACTGAPKSGPRPSSLLADARLTWRAAGDAVVAISVDVPARELRRAGEPGAPARLVLTAVLRDVDGPVLTSRTWNTDLPAPESRNLTAHRQQVELGVPSAGHVELELGILVRGHPLLAGWVRRWSLAALPSTSLQLDEPLFLEGREEDFPHLPRVYGEHQAVVVRSALFVPAPLALPQDSVAVVWHVSTGETPQAQASLGVPVATADVTPFELTLPRMPPGVHRLSLQVGDGTGMARVGDTWQVVPRIGTWSDSLPSTSVLQAVLPAADFRRLEDAAAEQRLQIWTAALERMASGSMQTALEVLQQRWQEASARFAEPQRSGWQTDRGRVFLRHGAPDELEHLQDPATQQALERWRYHATNHVYLFRDVQGTGRFELERTNDPDFP